MESEFGALRRQNSHSLVRLLVHHLILKFIRATATTDFYPGITLRFDPT